MGLISVFISIVPISFAPQPNLFEFSAVWQGHNKKYNAFILQLHTFSQHTFFRNSLEKIENRVLYNRFLLGVDHKASKMRPTINHHEAPYIEKENRYLNHLN